ncbi:MAG: hypothetical protein ACE5QV_07850, partial [Fidelibacterota bacterium]
LRKNIEKKSDLDRKYRMFVGNRFTAEELWTELLIISQYLPDNAWIEKIEIVNSDKGINTKRGNKKSMKIHRILRIKGILEFKWSGESSESLGDFIKKMESDYYLSNFYKDFVIAYTRLEKIKNSKLMNFLIEGRG